MVGLNGRALPSIDEELDRQDRNSVLQSDASDEVQNFKRNPLSPNMRRSLSYSLNRGPKPLLPRSLKEALQLAELLSKSKLIPKGFDTPETCLVGILYGMEVGLSPIAALQRMAVIDGRPTIWGDAALALVQSSGLLISIHEEIIEDKTTRTLTAICRVKREGRSEPTTGTFSTEDAIRAHLWQKPGPWTDYPKRMLTMRARAFALRDAFPDVLAGLYIREEFEGADSTRSNITARKILADEDEWSKAAHQQQSSTAQETQKTSLSEGGKDQIKSPYSIRRAPPPPCDVMSDAAVEIELSNPTEPFASNPTSPDSHEHEPLDPETLLDLFDSALCCALDLPTLEEIIDEFAERLKGASREIQERAQRIIERHQKRVEELDQSFKPGSILDLNGERSSGESDIVHDDHVGAPKNTEVDLPSGLKALLPNLGLGHLPSLGRRRKSSNRPPRSLASWNARQRLAEFKSTLTGQSDAESPDDEEAQP